jgi:hypothetical protein
MSLNSLNAVISSVASSMHTPSSPVCTTVQVAAVEP